MNNEEMYQATASIEVDHMPGQEYGDDEVVLVQEEWNEEEILVAPTNEGNSDDLVKAEVKSASEDADETNGLVELEMEVSQVDRNQPQCDGAPQCSSPTQDVAGRSNAPWVSPLAAASRPVIRVQPGEMSAVYAQAEASLAADGTFYQRSGVITRVEVDARSGDVSLVPVSAAELVRVLDERAAWQTLNRHTKEWMPADPPQRVCSVLANACRAGTLKSLVGIARQPYLRQGGDLCVTPGYDDKTGFYGVFDASEYSGLASTTRSDAEGALGRLLALLSEFPFAAEADRAAALAALLTAVVRPGLRAAPMFHVRAHQPGVGKSYLTQLIAAFASPAGAASLSFPATNEECDKLLLAELARGPAAIVFDNCTDDLKAFKRLCSVLTEESVSGRVLGTSKTMRVSTRVLVLSSGNNVGPVADMTRRCITIDLDTTEENPAARRFGRPNLLGDVLRDRGRYVADALTVVRAWIAAGSPRSSHCAFNSYRDWSEWCREPLLWLGQADPVAKVLEGMEADPERLELSLLLPLWHDRYGAKPARVRDLVAWSGERGDDAEKVLDVLMSIAGERGGINRRSLGWWLKRHVGRVVGGLRIESSARSGNAEAWRIAKI